MKKRMRIKLPKSEECIRSFLGPALDPDIIKKLHKSRQKVDYYYDSFEREQLEKAKGSHHSLKACEIESGLAEEKEIDYNQPAPVEYIHNPNYMHKTCGDCYYIAGVAGITDRYVCLASGNDIQPDYKACKRFL